jgi:hypothetical protein
MSDSRTRVLVVALVRRPGITTTPAAPVVAVRRLPARRPAKIARLLALAHHVQRSIDSGILIDRADAARRLGLTRARITQLLDLLLLAPDIQEALLQTEAVDGVEPVTERRVRPVLGSAVWGEQRRLFTRAAPSAVAGALPRGVNPLSGQA